MMPSADGTLKPTLGSGEEQKPLLREWERIWPECKDKVRYLILSNEHFIVFLDEVIDVDWSTKDSYGDHSDPKKFNVVVNTAAVLEATPCDGVSPTVYLHFKRPGSRLIKPTMRWSRQDARMHKIPKPICHNESRYAGSPSAYTTHSQSCAGTDTAFCRNDTSFSDCFGSE